MKKIVSLLLVMLLLVSLLPGCKKTETIWIVMEEHKAMEQHVRSIIKLFKEQNPNVEFELELLPNGNKVVDADMKKPGPQSCNDSGLQLWQERVRIFTSCPALPRLMRCCLKM